MIAFVDLQMPDWLVATLLGWLTGSVIVAAGLSAWFRRQRDLDGRGETPWSASNIFDDVEVRWKDGHVESRRVK